MRKCVKLLICILIAIIVIPLNNGVYAKELQEYDASEIIDYCKNKNEYPPKEVTIALLESWSTKLHAYVDQGSISDTSGVKKALSLVDGWKLKLGKLYDAIYDYQREISRDGKNSLKYFHDIATEDLITYEKMFDNIGRSNFNYDGIGWYSEFIDKLMKDVWGLTQTMADASVSGFYSGCLNELRENDQVGEYVGKDIVAFWEPDSTGGNTKLTSLAGRFLGVIQVFGSVVSVIALVLMGIRYMFGSVSEKAKYKETMIPYVVGCVMLFAITNIASAIYKFAITL